MSAPDSNAVLTPQLESEVGKLLGVEGLLNPAVRAISIKGPPGAGKTTLAFELIKAAHGGVYVSTRVKETVMIEQHRPFASLIEQGEVVIYQPTAQKTKIGTLEYEEAKKGIRMSDVVQKVTEVANDRNKHLIILDSWDAFTRELDDKDVAKAEHDLLTTVETSQQRIVFVGEGLELTSIDYLVDAIVALHDNEHEGRRIREIEWIKLRGKEIPQKTYLFTLANGEFRTLPKSQKEPLTPGTFVAQKFKPIPHSTERYSTGSRDLDLFLGGLRRGSVILLEFGKTISSRIHLPLTTIIRCNFLAQGGCTATIPSGEDPPERIRQVAYPYLDKTAVESSLAVAHFETAPADPWLIKLFGKSFENDQEIFWQKTNELKAGLDKPCFIYIGVDTIEYKYGNTEFMSPLMTAIQKVREYRDLMVFGAKPGSQLKQKLSDVADLHMKIDEVEGASILYLIKPPSGLMHLTYDYTEGYPTVKLTPIV